MNELIIEVNSKNKTGFGFRAYAETYDQMEIMDKIKTALKNDKKERNKIIDECIEKITKEYEEVKQNESAGDMWSIDELHGIEITYESCIYVLETMKGLETQTIKGGQVDLLVIPQKLLKEIAKIMEIEVDFTNKNNNGDYPPMDKYGFLAYLKDEFMEDNQFNAEKIVKITRLLDKNNISIENLKFLSV